MIMDLPLSKTIQLEDNIADTKREGYVSAQKGQQDFVLDFL